MRVAVVLGIVLAAGLAAGGVAAQGPAAQAPGGPEVVAVGGYEFDVPASAPVLACVVGRDETLDGLASLTVQAFLRQPDGVRALPAYESAAVGPFAGAAVGSCYVLAPAPVTG